MRYHQCDPPRSGIRRPLELGLATAGPLAWHNQESDWSPLPPSLLPSRCHFHYVWASD